MLLFLLLLLLLPIASGFNLQAVRPTSPSASVPIDRHIRHAASPRFAERHPTEKYAKTMDSPTGPLDDTFVVKRKDMSLSHEATQLSRRNILRGVLWASIMYCGSGPIAGASAAYTVKRVEPDETETYAVAQKGNRPLRVLWVGSGDMRGVFRGLFPSGNEVIALDLRKPDATDLSAAIKYATEHGYDLRFEQGDATDLKFTDETFDVVVCSMFLCQDFDPEVVVSEIRRVLKPGGRFGFYEHVEDIDKVIVGKVFGDRSVIRVQHYPEKLNIMAGVVRKV